MKKKTILCRITLCVLLLAVVAGMTVLFDSKSEAAGTYTITYSNGGDDFVRNLPSPTVVGAGQYFSISSTIPKRSNATFKGWSTSKSNPTANNTYYAGQGSVRATRDMTLYPIWEYEEGKVTVAVYDPQKKEYIEKSLNIDQYYNIGALFGYKYQEGNCISTSVYCERCKCYQVLMYVYKYGMNKPDGAEVSSFRARNDFVVTRYRRKACGHVNGRVSRSGELY